MKDPAYTVEFGKIYFQTRSSGTRPGWKRLKNPVVARLLFENNQINLMAMIRNKIPWNSIESKYILPHRTLLLSVVSNEVITQVVMVGMSIIMKAVFKR